MDIVIDFPFGFNWLGQKRGSISSLISLANRALLHYRVERIFISRYCVFRGSTVIILDSCWLALYYNDTLVVNPVALASGNSYIRQLRRTIALLFLREYILESSPARRLVMTASIDQVKLNHAFSTLY